MGGFSFKLILVECIGKNLRLQFAQQACSYRNWFRWNDETQRVVHTSKEMMITHDYSAVVAVPVGFAAVKSCAEPYGLP